MVSRQRQTTGRETCSERRSAKLWQPALVLRRIAAVSLTSAGLDEHPRLGEAPFRQRLLQDGQDVQEGVEAMPPHVLHRLHFDSGARQVRERDASQEAIETPVCD